MEHDGSSYSRRHPLWLLLPAFCSQEFALGCHHSALDEQTFVSGFYGILIELRSRLKVIRTFQRNLVLCNITEREPFHWVLINVHAADEKDETHSRPSIQPSFILKHGLLLFVLLSVMKLLINPLSVNLSKLLHTLWRYEVAFRLLQRKQRGALAQ